MHYTLLIFWASALITIRVSLAQTLNPTMCVPGSGVTAFSKCNNLYSSISYCAGSSVSAGAAYVSCYCNQNLFNEIIDCNSEERRCLGNNLIDADVQSQINLWHSACDKKISFTPTTPPLSSITAAFNGDSCASIDQACLTVSQSGSSCFASYPSSRAQFSSCVCDEKLISLQYTCGIIGNLSCLLTTADVAEIPAYSFCTNGPAVLSSIRDKSTLPSTAPFTKTTSGPGTITSPTTAAPFTPSKPSLPASSTSTKSSAAVTDYQFQRKLLQICFGLANLLIYLV